MDGIAVPADAGKRPLSRRATLEPDGTDGGSRPVITQASRVLEIYAACIAVSAIVLWVLPTRVSGRLMPKRNLRHRARFGRDRTNRSLPGIEH
jgi:hypothetical protein